MPIEMSGAICGGVISRTMERELMDEYGVWATAMNIVLPDDQYERYIKLKRQGRHKEAEADFFKEGEG